MVQCMCVNLYNPRDRRLCWKLLKSLAIISACSCHVSCSILAAVSIIFLINIYAIYT